MVHSIYLGVTGNNFHIIFFSLKIVFVLANNVDPVEIPHHAVFHLGLHCLPNSEI